MMNKGNPLRDLVDRLNAEFKLSEDFKLKVTHMIEKLDGYLLGAQQVELLSNKIRETYQRQVLIEACREESLRSLERIQLSLSAYSNALNEIGRRLTQAEVTLDRLVSLKAKVLVVDPSNENHSITPHDKQKAKAMIAFVNLDAKSGRIH
jgi:hypothetical protein